MLGCSKTAVQRPVPVSAKCSTNLCSRACSQSQASHTELISYSDVTVVHDVTQYCKTPAPKLTQSCKPSEPSPFSLILKPSLTCLLPKSIHLYVPLGGGTAAERGTGEAQAHWLQARHAANQACSRDPRHMQSSPCCLMPYGEKCSAHIYHRPKASSASHAATCQMCCAAYSGPGMQIVPRSPTPASEVYFCFFCCFVTLA